VVTAVNREAMGIYLWHQPVLVAVTALTAHLGRALPGLHTAPAGPGWVAARICWLPLFTLVLAVLVAPRRGPASRRRGPVAPGSPAGRGGPAEGIAGIGSPERASAG
jgi:peptidoglycan/LPS O-acetylase OafA/YrhL